MSKKGTDKVISSSCFNPLHVFKCTANQLTGFYVRATHFNELTYYRPVLPIIQKPVY